MTREVLKRLGFRVAHQRLAQLVPFVGAVVNAGLNASSISVLGDRAQDAYRLRFLTEKYDLDPAEWLASHSVDDPEEESIDLEALVREAEADDPDKDSEA